MLDETALEAMIARQRALGDAPTRPQDVVRTAQTEEYEVYERKEEPEEAPAAAPAPAPTAPQAPAQEEEFEVFEREAPQPEPAPEPPQAAPPQQPAAPTPPPAPQPAPEPTPEATPEPARQPFAPQPTRRPEVWPPLGARAAPSASTPAAAPATPPTEPEFTPRSHVPTPEPEAEPAPAPTAHAFPDLSTTGGSDSAPRIAIVQALFNEEITGDMAGLARQKADKLGAPVVQHVTVPGVYDLPLACQALLQRDDVDAVVALGCVVTGQTKHDEVITHATAKTLQEVSLATGKPVGFGVIGPGMTWKQAEARVVNGKHAVEAAVAQWRVLRGLTA